MSTPNVGDEFVSKDPRDRGRRVVVTQVLGKPPDSVEVENVAEGKKRRTILTLKTLSTRWAPAPPPPPELKELLP